jgi:hypothetical protein
MPSNSGSRNRRPSFHRRMAAPSALTILYSESPRIGPQTTLADSWCRMRLIRVFVTRCAQLLHSQWKRDILVSASQMTAQYSETA